MFAFPELSIPISIFLFVFGAYMLFYLLYSLFNIYHLVRYGVYGFGLYLLVTIFTGGTILLVSGSFFMLSEFNWNEPISINTVISDFTQSKNEVINPNLFPPL